jgi:hypothetical protein
MAVVDEGAPQGEATMTIKILNEFLLFSCLAAFVTGGSCSRPRAC